MSRPVVIMNFTHIYEQEPFVRNKNFTWIDCTDLNGTDCYCDEQAEKALRAKIAPYPPEGIHFIDSGNYHYLSKFWTDKIVRPFSLVVFDHHPDMQPTLFDNLMSCGCWVQSVLDTNPYIRKACIVGASDELVRAIDTAYRNRLEFYSETELSHEEGWKRFTSEHIDEPVYISVDKDVLNSASAVTNWDQGSLSLKELESLLSIIIRRQQVIGIDICGECQDSLNYFELERSERLNSHANEELIRLIG
jgi:arginase family enzyme